jgi:transcriptional regulator with XRE-family HTH domain
MPKKAENFDMWEMAYRQELGVRLKSFRVRKGISQQEVASETGVQQPSLVRYESGLRCPSLYFIKLFVEKFDCDLHWLVFGDDDQDKRTFPPEP